MKTALSFMACPHLPQPDPEMDWKVLNAFGKTRNAEFFYAALKYGHYLWLQGNSARAILALDRALFAKLAGDESILQDWPLPYEAIAWMIVKNPQDVFIGNPRVHYQHLADRVNGSDKEQKKWRAWACWLIVRKIAPELPADPKHTVEEPDAETITAKLVQYGITGEAEAWKQVVFRVAQ